MQMKEEFMKNGFFLITGTSKGIGEAVAQNLLEKGHTVLGISRSVPDKLTSKRFYHLVFDLNNTAQINQIMEKVDEIVDNRSYDFICLINNASVAEPLGSIEKCPATEIDAHVRIGLIAPMILTSMFIQKYSNIKIRKKVAFITSGSAFEALNDESIYCSTKAGLNMFAQCIGLEQNKREYGFEVISIRPGMVDTPMQLLARSKSSDEYAWAELGKQVYQEGKLQKPNVVAEKIITIIENKYEQGKCISVSEV
jgi:benzil reductase ((S)-benzoin forming)